VAHDLKGLTAERDILKTKVEALEARNAELTQERPSAPARERVPAGDDRCGCWDRQAFHRTVGMLPGEVCVNKGAPAGERGEGSELVLPAGSLVEMRNNARVYVIGYTYTVDTTGSPSGRFDGIDVRDESRIEQYRLDWVKRVLVRGTGGEALLTPAPAAVREPEGRPATVAEIKALEGNGIVQAAPPLPEPSEAQCEGGVTVRWCPKCGRCTCPAQNEKPDGWEENPTCPIHGDASTHGEPSEALEALAADVVNRFNPIAGHIVLRDLVLAALARVKGQ
jgi:hypothetical protein